MASTAPRRTSPLDATDGIDNSAVSIAARLCWHASRICQAMAASLDAFQANVEEISAHCDALIEMALELDRGVTRDTVAGGGRP